MNEISDGSVDNKSKNKIVNVKTLRGEGLKNLFILIFYTIEIKNLTMAAVVQWQHRQTWCKGLWIF